MSWRIWSFLILIGVILATQTYALDPVAKARLLLGLKAVETPVTLTEAFYRKMDELLKDAPSKTKIDEVLDAYLLLSHRLTQKDQSVVIEPSLDLEERFLERIRGAGDLAFLSAIFDVYKQAIHSDLFSARRKVSMASSDLTAQSHGITDEVRHQAAEEVRIYSEELAELVAQHIGALLRDHQLSPYLREVKDPRFLGGRSEIHWQHFEARLKALLEASPERVLPLEFSSIEDWDRVSQGLFRFEHFLSKNDLRISDPPLATFFLRSFFVEIRGTDLSPLDLIQRFFSRVGHPDPIESVSFLVLLDARLTSHLISEITAGVPESRLLEAWQALDWVRLLVNDLAEPEPLKLPQLLGLLRTPSIVKHYPKISQDALSLIRSPVSRLVARCSLYLTRRFR